jgi:hypothetical protein
VSKNFSEAFNTTFYENPFSGSRFVAGQDLGRREGNRRNVVTFDENEPEYESIIFVIIVVSAVAAAATVPIILRKYRAMTHLHDISKDVCLFPKLLNTLRGNFFLGQSTERCRSNL